MCSQINSWKKKATKQGCSSLRNSGFLKFYQEQVDNLAADLDRQMIVSSTGRIQVASVVQSAWFALSDEERRRLVHAVVCVLLVYSLLDFSH